MSSSLTQVSIERFVRTMLGSPVVEVELTSEQIEEITVQALDIYGGQKPVEKFGSVTVSAGIQKYVMTYNQIGRGIIEVFRPDLMRSQQTLDQFDVFKFHTFQANLNPGDFYLERIWWNEVKRSAGADEDWEFIGDPTTGGGTLWLSPSPSEGFACTYIYVVEPTLTEVPRVDDEWIKGYVLAMCKMVLGGIRRKFDGIQGAENSLKLDGAELISEGRSERTALEEYINNRGMVTPPMRG